MAVFPYQLFTTRIKFQTRLEQKSLMERQTTYEQSWPILQDSWYKGTGLNNYLTAVQKNLPDLAVWAYQPVHNAWVLLAVEAGLAGLILFIVIFWQMLKNRSDDWPLLLVILIIGLFDHYFVSFYFGVILIWLIMGLSYKPGSNISN